MESREIKLTIDSNLENVFLIGLAVNSICSHTLLSDLESYHIEVCVVEAVNNMIKHAYGNETGHEVEVNIALHSDRIVFQLRDRGNVMELPDKPELNIDPDDLENLPEGGMGVFIISKIMDTVTYKQFSDCNVFTITKSFGSDEKTDRATNG
jgi:Anti-sigma regulatory factor (Ser/Thr protein kinase)